MKQATLLLSVTDYPRFISLSSSLSQWLKFIPDDQDDSGLQLANLPALFNFDFRDQSTQKVDDNNTVITPATLTVYEKVFNNLYQFGPSSYAVTDGIAGQTQLNDFLFVMPNPKKPFEQRTVPVFNKSASQSKISLPKINTFAIPYLMACLQNTSPFGLKPNPIVLVLGAQQADGNHENCDLYVSEFATLDCNMGNVSRYKMNSNAQEKGIHPDMALYHANMPSVHNQHFDSVDFDNLFDIYQRSQ